MNPENTSKLFTAYPLLYRNLREQHFECDDGWFDLVWQVSAEIEAAAQLEGIPKTAEAWPSVGILKQKFGTLRVQLDTRLTRVSEAIDAVIAKAYEQSMEICELCGAPALRPDSIRRSIGAIKTLCENCRKAHCPPPHPQDITVLPVWMQERNSKLK